MKRKSTTRRSTKPGVPQSVLDGLLSIVSPEHRIRHFKNEIVDQQRRFAGAIIGAQKTGAHAHRDLGVVALVVMALINRLLAEGRLDPNLLRAEIDALDALDGARNRRLFIRDFRRLLELEPKAPAPAVGTAKAAINLRRTAK